MRNPNITVIKLGYTSYAFESMEDAMATMSLLAKAVQVENDAWTHSKMSGCTHFLKDTDDLPEMALIPVNKFNPHQTSKEAKESWERDERNRQDVNQQMKEIYTLPAPGAPNQPDDAPF